MRKKAFLWLDFLWENATLRAYTSIFDFLHFIFVQHISVLFREISDIFRTVSPRKYVVDATQGLGWHTKMLLENTDIDGLCLGIDRDADNIALANEHLRGFSHHRSEHSSFAELSDILARQGIPYIDFILYDLWVSSAHYDDASRGFSLRFDAPLDMRFNRSTGKTAANLVMTLSEEELRRIFFQYADEKKAPFIARAIVEARKSEDIVSTYQLVRIISEASFDKKSPLRVFQALRIAVNNEFWHIIDSLTQAVEHLRIGGKIAIITFHSIEDRLVKQFFSPLLEGVQDEITGQIVIPPKYKKYNKKPIVPTEDEIIHNPRSRSAKLRVYERIS